MNPPALIFSALLLGAFVLLAGLYGLLYSIGVLRGARHLVTAAYGCWALQFLVTLSIVVLTPLEIGWKILIVASCLAYLEIPRLTWRYLRQLHSFTEGDRPIIP
jgi:uncharacterized membrane protein